MALMIAIHRRLGTWQKRVDAFIALTAFQKRKMAEAGLPEDRIYIKSHFYADPPDAFPWPDREPKVVFIGRLGMEKGIHVLIDAWKQWGGEAPMLEIIGDGPERVALEKQADENNPAGNILFMGQLPYEETQTILSRASLLILPSLCFEGFPMAIREAFALGVPVAASQLGSIPDIVTDGQDGVLFLPGNADDLLENVSSVWQKPQALAVMGENARKAFEERYTAERNYEMLMEVYRRARARAQQAAR